MKKVLIPSIAVLAFVLTGCSGGSQQTPSTQTSSNEEANVDSDLTESGYVRGALTDPALYDYLNKQSSGLTNRDIISTNQSSDKVGKSSPFQVNRKNDISGIAQIISDSKIKITSFNYNGSCGPIYFGLAIRNNLSKPLAKLKEIAVPQSNSAFELTIPSNISLIQFESLGIYCNTQEDPISTAEF